MFRTILIPLTLVLLIAAPAFAQFKEGAPGGAKTGPAQAHRWKAGIIIQASSGPCRSVTGYVPVPWSGQSKRSRWSSRTFHAGVKISYQTLNDSAKLMMISIPWIAGGETAKAEVTFECNRSMQLPPEDKVGVLSCPTQRNSTRHCIAIWGQAP